MKTSLALPLALLALLLGSACAPHPARTAYANSHGCPLQSTKVSLTAPHRFLVVGCGGSTEYVCVSGQCEAVPGSFADTSVAIAPVSRRSSDVVQKQQHPDGYDVYTVHV